MTDFATCKIAAEMPETDPSVAMYFDFTRMDDAEGFFEILAKAIADGSIKIGPLRFPPAKTVCGAEGEAAPAPPSLPTAVDGGDVNPADPGRMPVPDLIIGTAEGGFVPAMLFYAPEGTDAKLVARENGFDSYFMDMEDTLPVEDPLHAEYFDKGGSTEEILPRWTPPAPEPGYALVGKWDTENGPTAFYVRKRPDAGEGPR